VSNEWLPWNGGMVGWWGVGAKGVATVVADALYAHPVFTQRVNNFAFDLAGDGDAAEGAVDVLHAV